MAQPRLKKLNTLKIFNLLFKVKDFWDGEHSAAAFFTTPSASTISHQ